MKIDYTTLVYDNCNDKINFKLMGTVNKSWLENSVHKSNHENVIGNARCCHLATGPTNRAEHF